MWEKKGSSVGIHNKDTTYTWSTTGTAADGTAFTVFLATLNTAPCFAGHCDWRLPTTAGVAPDLTGQAAELESILAAPYPCTVHPCVPPEFRTACTPGCTALDCSCTQSSGYWSASTSAGGPGSAWLVGLGDGGVGSANKPLAYYVRAVRGGL
jgi:hypothetical protein